MDLTVLSRGSSQEDLITALRLVNAEAQRTMQRDHLNRPNDRWAALHEFMNTLLDMLEPADAADL